MLKTDIAKTYYNKLSCRIYVLGASTEGESVLFIVYGNDEVIYSCITDSFVIDDVNIPKKLIQDIGLDHVTEIFWTHPHDDHSEGLIDLIETFKPEFVYIPSNLQKLPDNIPEISRNTLNVINEYHSYDSRYKYQPRIFDIGTNYTVLEKELKVAGENIPFLIYAIAPVVGKVRRNVVGDNYNRLNDFSIAIFIALGDYSLLLTGDIQDQMITHIINDLEKTLFIPNFLKIPHHGSNGSLEILSLFDSSKKIDIAVTTNKNTSKLPKPEALKKYASCCDRVFQIHTDTKGSAIFKLEIDILEGKVKEEKITNYKLYIDSKEVIS